VLDLKDDKAAAEINDLTREVLAMLEPEPEVS
jgi:hypothetical protein